MSTDDDDSPDPTSVPVRRTQQQPGKVMRIAAMVKQLQQVAHTDPFDAAGRNRLRDIHTRTINELADGLAPELRDELQRLALPFSDDSVPSDAELRIAQAQLVGWLEGLVHGIQAALSGQQTTATAQLDQFRQYALPPHATPHSLDDQLTTYASREPGPRVKEHGPEAASS